MKPKHTVTASVKTARRLLAAAILVAGAAGLHAQNAVRAHDFVGTYKGQAAQGMAIHRDTAFLFQNTGLCRLYNLKTGKFINDFALDTAAPENHSNCAVFGVEYPEGNHAYPALYVSECYGQHRCFVEDVRDCGAGLIQTLRMGTGGAEDRPFDWYVDRDGKMLYSIAIISGADEDGNRAYLLSRLALPKINAGDITFGKKDIIGQFTIKFRHLSQGGVIRGDYLYMPVGHAKPADAKKDKKDRALLVVNLRTKQIERTIDLSADVALEPEDADFHGDALLMYCGQAGGLFRIEGI